jgi:hypothetical protein
MKPQTFREFVTYRRIDTLFIFSEKRRPLTKIANTCAAFTTPQKRFFCRAANNYFLNYLFSLIVLWVGQIFSLDNPPACRPYPLGQGG